MVLVDTSVWSLALRRRHTALGERERQLVEMWRGLAQSGRAALIGIVRQELLSGIADQRVFSQLRERINVLPHLIVGAEQHDLAAQLYNRCRSQGVTPTAFDMLICAACVSHRVPLFTDDADFRPLAPVTGLRLWGTELH